MPRKTSRRKPAPSNRRPKSVFLNVPYDRAFTRLFLAYITATSAFGFVPHATLEIPTSRRRLDRILSLISSSNYSLHDLSRVQLDPSHPRTPRFNMPFELGLAVSLQKSSHPHHSWYLLEAQPHRVLKSLSDLNGTEAFIHHGTVRGLFSELCNIFIRTSRPPSFPQMLSIYRLLHSQLPRILSSSGSTSPYTARAFADLCTLAAFAASQLPKP